MREVSNSDIESHAHCGDSSGQVVHLGEQAFSAATVRAAVVRSVATVAATEPSRVLDDATLESLAVDSFMLTEVLVELEDTLDVELPAAVLAEVERHPPSTVGDLVSCLRAPCNS